MNLKEYTTYATRMILNARKLRAHHTHLAHNITRLCILISSSIVSSAFLSKIMECFWGVGHVQARHIDAAIWQPFYVHPVSMNMMVQSTMIIGGMRVLT